MSTSAVWGGGKPISTRAPRSVFPVVLIDLSPRSGTPVKPYEKVLSGPKEDQALKAAAEWSSSKLSPGKDWTKSWYYPLEHPDPWPVGTDLRCWNCTHQFEGSPFPLPWAFDKQKQKVCRSVYFLMEKWSFLEYMSWR